MGIALIKNLSKKMIKEFGKGFTVANLKNMRQFYLIFQKGHVLSDQLSWTHYRLLSSKDKEKVSKEIYKLEPQIKKAEDIIKAHYVLEFLGLSENINFLEKI